MKILIVGGAGMLGHTLWEVWADRFDTYVTLRSSFDAYARFNLFDRSHTIDGVDVQNFDAMVRALEAVRPDVVVNCVGIVKQHWAASDPLSSITVNSLFPHRLAHLCRAAGARLIHISTDCVFSGRKGNYAESDIPDAEDLYGRSKLLGEPSYDGCLTLRTSLIGRELQSCHGLLEWLLAQRGRRVRGYTRAIFSGFTTRSLAHVIARIITEQPEMHGIWHVASKPVSKFELLSLIKNIYHLNVEIEADDTVVYDRSLDASRFRQRMRFVPQEWPVMIQQMWIDSESRMELRRSNVNR